MQSFQHDFGHALSVDAEAIGEPGNRRFRLLVRSSSQTASIWMENQQLAGIGSWIEETQERLDREHPSTEADAEPTPFDDTFAVEFRASQIGLGYAEAEEQFAIQAFDIEAESQVPAFRCFISRGQARVLNRKIAGLVAAGRPICPLCEMPIDPEGHVCPRSNGHHAGVTV